MNIARGLIYTHTIFYTLTDHGCESDLGLCVCVDIISWILADILAPLSEFTDDLLEKENKLQSSVITHST